MLGPVCWHFLMYHRTLIGRMLRTQSSYNVRTMAEEFVQYCTNFSGALYEHCTNFFSIVRTLYEHCANIV